MIRDERERVARAHDTVPHKLCLDLPHSAGKSLKNFMCNIVMILS